MKQPIRKIREGNGKLQANTNSDLMDRPSWNFGHVDRLKKNQMCTPYSNVGSGNSGIRSEQVDTATWSVERKRKEGIEGFVESRELRRNKNGGSADRGKRPRQPNSGIQNTLYRVPTVHYLGR